MKIVEQAHDWIEVEYRGKRYSAGIFYDAHYHPEQWETEISKIKKMTWREFCKSYSPAPVENTNNTKTRTLRALNAILRGFKPTTGSHYDLKTMRKRRRGQERIEKMGLKIRL